MFLCWFSRCCHQLFPSAVTIPASKVFSLYFSILFCNQIKILFFCCCWVSHDNQYLWQFEKSSKNAWEIIKNPVTEHFSFEINQYALFVNKFELTLPRATSVPMVLMSMSIWKSQLPKDNERHLRMVECSRCRILLQQKKQPSLEFLLQTMEFFFYLPLFSNIGLFLSAEDNSSSNIFTPPFYRAFNGL